MLATANRRGLLPEVARVMAELGQVVLDTHAASLTLRELALIGQAREINGKSCDVANELPWGGSVITGGSSSPFRPALSAGFFCDPMVDCIHVVANNPVFLYKSGAVRSPGSVVKISRQEQT